MPVNLENLEAEIDSLAQKLGMGKGAVKHAPGGFEDTQAEGNPELEAQQNGFYQKLFGEGFFKNIDDYYGISDKLNRADKWIEDNIYSLIPGMKERKTYMPKTSPEDRKWLEEFLKDTSKGANQPTQQGIRFFR